MIENGVIDMAEGRVEAALDETRSAGSAIQAVLEFLARPAGLS